MATEVVKTREEITKVLVDLVPKTLRFRYTGQDGRQSDRHVEPYEIKTMADGRIQLIAWCLEKDATRRFDLDRIERLTVGEPFRPRFNITVPL